jgi:hypothetical protein
LKYPVDQQELLAALKECWYFHDNINICKVATRISWMEKRDTGISLCCINKVPSIKCMMQRLNTTVQNSIQEPIAIILKCRTKCQKI